MVAYVGGTFVWRGAWILHSKYVLQDLLKSSRELVVVLLLQPFSGKVVYSSSFLVAMLTNNMVTAFTCVGHISAMMLKKSTITFILGSWQVCFMPAFMDIA